MKEKELTTAKLNLNNLLNFGNGKKEQAKEEPQEQFQGVNVPPGYVLKKENKSKRVPLLLEPYAYKLLKDRAEQEGESVNSLCNRIIKAYLNI